MTDLGIGTVPQWGAFGALLALLGVALRFLPALVSAFNERRRDRASIEGDQYRRMDERLQRVEASEEECRNDLIDAVGRIAELEGYMMGQGQSRQEAATIVAAERLIDKAKDEGK